jgi:hypothetical protein
MAFPQDPLPIRAEMQINGTWTEVTSSVRNAGDINITGGFAPEQSSLSPATISFNLNNRAGLYSNDNPNSAYYGLLPTGTPFRVSVEESTPFVRLLNGVRQDPLTSSVLDFYIAYVSTTDKAVLDVTGDLDLRIEIDPDQWQLGSAGFALAGKYDTTGNQRSWAWVVQPSGVMRLYWTTDGATSPLSSGTYADSTVVLPGAGRLALRVTIDVNNGAAGRTVTFYTSDSITGTWTQLGATVVQSGTTSIFSSTSWLTVGGIVNQSTQQSSFLTIAAAGYVLPFAGRIHRFQMYSGIAGTLVADMNPAGQAEGTTSWSDGLGTPNTWTLGGTAGAEITLADYRGYGEISEMPQEWDPTGTDVYSPTIASGIIRRLTQGAQALNSPIYRNLRQYIGAGAVGYVPLEGGSQSTAAGNAVPGQPAAYVTNVQFSTDNEFPSSAGVMTVVDSDSYIAGTVTGAAPTDQATLIFYYKIDSVTPSDTNTVHMYTSGTAKQVTLSIGAADYRVTAYDANGTSLGTTAALFGTEAQPGQWLAVQMRVNKNGAGIDINLAWYPLGTTTNFYGTSAVNIAVGTVGSHRGFATSRNIAALNLNASFAHFMCLNLVGFEFANSAFAKMSIGFRGEYAAERFLRLLREEGITGRCVGWPADTITMGPQLIDTLMANLSDCAVTSGSLIYEARDQAALMIRTYRSLLAQQAVALTYARPSSHLAGSFRPTIDDQGLRNDITANSPGGAFARSTVDTGPRSTLSPPNGVGRYDSIITVNPATDEQLAGLAQWATFIGTWPDRRVPSIEVWLERSVFVASSTLTRSLRSIDPGDRITVGSVPVWVGGGNADTLVRGYTETLMNRGHRLAFSTVPYGPYLAANDLSGSDNSRRRASTAYANARVALAATSTATSLVTQITEGAVFGTTANRPANFPAGGGPAFPLMVAGEQIYATAIADWIADDFNRSVSNGWGSTSTGASAWTVSGGSASDYSANATQGVHNLSTTAVDRTSTLTLTARVPEVLLTHVRMPAVLTGVGGTCTVGIRVGSSTSYVTLWVQMTTAGGMTHWISQVVNGVETTFDSLFPTTGLTSTTAFSARLHVPAALGGVAWGRVWAETAAEPSGMTTQITTTAANATGDVQLRSTRNASSTNAAPFYVEFDGLSLPRNQLVTATRSVNLVVKAQAIDNIVTLGDQFYVART